MLIFGDPKHNTSASETRTLYNNLQHSSRDEPIETDVLIDGYIYGIFVLHSRLDCEQYDDAPFIVINLIPV